MNNKGERLNENDTIDSTHFLLPYLGIADTLGNYIKAIEEIDDYDERQLAYSGYYQQKGRFEDALKIAEPYLNHENPYLRASACFICHFSSLGIGDKKSAVNALSQLKKIEFGEGVPYKGSTFAEIILITMFSGAKELKIDENILKALPEGIRIYFNFFIALNTLLSGKNEEAIGIAKSTLFLCAGRYPIQSIYLNILLGAAYTFLKDYKQADMYYKDASDLAFPEGIILPFIQQNILLLGFDRRSMKHGGGISADELAKINVLAKVYIATWSALCNNVKGVADAKLSIVEFTIGILFKHDFSIKEISSIMQISMNTVKTHLVALRIKTVTSRRKEILKIDI